MHTAQWMWKNQRKKCTKLIIDAASITALLRYIGAQVLTVISVFPAFLILLTFSCTQDFGLKKGGKNLLCGSDLDRCPSFAIFSTYLISNCTPPLKGQCHEIFCFWFFSWISFPPAPEYSIRTVSNFFENSRRYSQVKVHCRHDTSMTHFATGINDTGGKFYHHFR